MPALDGKFLKVGENSMPFFTESIGYLMIRVNLK
jgi:hypothetical protein